MRMVKMPSSEMSMFPKHIKPALLFNCSYCDFKHQSFKQVSFHVIENHPKKLDHKLRTLKRTAQDVAVINNSAYLSKNGLKRQRTFLFESSAKPKKAESKRSFSCALCNTKCDKEVILNIHKRCHVEGSDKLICCFCGKQAPTAKAWYGLFIHMVNKHPAEVPAPLSCSVCKKGFVKEFDLQKHMICHSSARPFSCDLCDYSFKYKRNLHDHKVLKHKMGTAQERLALITKLKTRNRPELDVNKPWLQCAHCDYKTKFPAKINVHAKIHAGIKDMACQYCDYRTGDRSCLKRHEWRHRADKPFSCTYCGFTCIQRPQILSHYKNKHSLLPRDASKLVQHINGSRSYVAEEDLVDCVSDITREVEISSENHTISIPDVSDNPVDLDLLTEAAKDCWLPVKLSYTPLIQVKVQCDNS
ncbi:hypothetical protein EB796_021795 [Bugula neritina]|uniref:C2H2-type domain-containing protein n=1 Tax=Bugula neritina TaxID=10212 RepID=A0A7J7J1F3_BUGNE|nr:hypothetical protein EB796_021795 [Bugula neritina]